MLEKSRFEDIKLTNPLYTNNIAEGITKENIIIIITSMKITRINAIDDNKIDT